jgi:hypothetical protein
MIQANYWDWNRAKVNARRTYEIAREHGKPIVVMEPLFGGKLASPDSPIAELLKKANPAVSVASWAIRFVGQLDGVFVNLSGMSALEQVVDNINTYKDFKPLSKDEMKIIKEAIKILESVPRIECTSCNYCKDCPADIPIPSLINLYNDHLIHKTTTNLAGSYNWMTGGRGKAKGCTECGHCEDICPQDLDIIDTMKRVSKLFD